MPQAKEKLAASTRGEIVVAAESFVKQFEGSDWHFTADVTLVRAGHPVLTGVEHLFKPLVPHYEVAG